MSNEKKNKDSHAVSYGMTFAALLGAGKKPHGEDENHAKAAQHKPYVFITMYHEGQCLAVPDRSVILTDKKYLGKRKYIS